MSPFPHLVEAEVRRAATLHPPLANHDEALSVLLEEVFEVQVEVFKKRSERADEKLLEELVQVAAMARRWADCCGLKVVLGVPFSHGVGIAGRFLRREQPKANSDHEELTRLRRQTHKLEAWSAAHGPDLKGVPHDVVLVLLVVAATCQRWAEDRGLVPLAAPPEPPGVAATTAAPPEPPAPEPDAPTPAPTQPEATDAPAQETV